MVVELAGAYTLFLVTRSWFFGFPFCLTYGQFSMELTCARYLVVLRYGWILVWG